MLVLPGVQTSPLHERPWLAQRTDLSEPVIAILQRACIGGASPIVLTVVDTASTNLPSSQFSKIANTADGSATFQLQQVLASFVLLCPVIMLCFQRDAKAFVGNHSPM